MSAPTQLMSHRRRRARMTDRGPRPSVTRRACLDAGKLALARQFRQQPTHSEAIAWQLLRNRRILGLKFRRQQVIAGFIVDFYCAAARLVLELDGKVHEDPSTRERDARRTEVLMQRGL